MKIFEFVSPQVDKSKLAALSQFLLSRAADTDAQKTFSVKSFISLANNMGISLTAQQLKDQSLLPPLGNIIDSVEIDPNDPESGTVYFKGAEEKTPDGDTMTVDQARKTVDSMAKRAIDI